MKTLEDLLKTYSEEEMNSVVEMFHEVKGRKVSSLIQLEEYFNVMNFIRRYVRSLPMELFVKLPEDVRDFSMEE